MNSFSSKILKIGINPYLPLPDSVLKEIFNSAGKEKSPIQVKGTLNGKPFLQNLVKYKKQWRLYLNTPMRKAAGIDVGDIANVTLEFDSKPRILKIHPKLSKALAENKKANAVFMQLSPSHQKEIIRYISFLKTEISVDKNIKKAIQYLLGKEGFIGRVSVTQKTK